MIFWGLTDFSRGCSIPAPSPERGRREDSFPPREAVGLGQVDDSSDDVVGSSNADVEVGS